MDYPSNPKQAQKRIDRIHSFRDELNTLELHEVLKLSPKAKEALSHYHARLIAELNEKFDTDATLTGKKLSLGMRILTFLGGLALSASVFFFFYRIWGNLSTFLQVCILVSGPLVSLGLMEWAARKEKTYYYATLFGLLTFTCFVLNLHVLGQIFNLTPSPRAFLVWGLFGIILAYHRGMKLLLIPGLLSLLTYLTSSVGSLAGHHWLSFWERPESFIVSGAVFLIFSILIQHREYPGFPWIYQLIGLLSIFLPVWYLGLSGFSSYINLDSKTVELIYQVLGFILAGLTIWLGIRFRQNGVANIGTTFFTLFLYTKFFDWWWEDIPKYLFFLILSIITLSLLALFKKLRNKFREGL